MSPWLIASILFLIAIFGWELTRKNSSHWYMTVGLAIGAILIAGIIIAIDRGAQSADTEVWSGHVSSWSHEEEYDKWTDPVTTCTTDSNGRQSCSTTPGYWTHYDATNHIKTTDDGWVSVSRSPDGKKFNDRWPNDAAPLKEYWPLGTPSASTHTYVNKVKASYSIYRHPEIDLKDYPDLPSYPKKVTGYINLDRIVGDFPNKDQANVLLQNWNSEMNKFIPDPENPKKTRSWKQVNLIFVNVGENKPMDWGIALQDKWNGGNKNDFVVSMSMNKDGKVNWVYAFSWSEVEILKLEVQDYIMQLGTITDTIPVINNVAQQVIDKFERKEFKDFAYLAIEPSGIAMFFVYLVFVIAIAIHVYHGIVKQREEDYYNRRRGRY